MSKLLQCNNNCDWIGREEELASVTIDANDPTRVLSVKYPSGKYVSVSKKKCDETKIVKGCPDYYSDLLTEIKSDPSNFDANEVAEKYQMDSNGYSFKSDDNFLNQHHLPCYIPENADSYKDVWSRQDLEDEVRKWLEDEDNVASLEEERGEEIEVNDEFVTQLTTQIYEDLEWESPSTKLESLTY